MALVGLIVVGYALLHSMHPTESVMQKHIITLDLKDIPDGTIKEFVLPLSPSVYVLHRTADDLKNIDVLSNKVRDPDSLYSNQPAYTQNRYHSIKPEWFISYEYAPYRNFPVFFIEKQKTEEENSVIWSGGFIDPYEGSRFDKAGRVYLQSHPGETNLPIPEHGYISDTKVEVYVYKNR